MKLHAIIGFLIIVFHSAIFAQSIEIIYPNGGEIVCNKGYQRILSSVSGYRDYKFYLSTDNGNSWNEFSIFNMLWEPSEKPSVESDSCLIRIVAKSDSAIWGQSDSVFTLTNYEPDPELFYSDFVNANALKYENNLNKDYTKIGFTLEWTDKNNELWNMFWTNGFSVASIWGSDTLVSGSFFGSRNHLPGIMLPDETSDDPHKEKYKFWRLNKKWKNSANDSLRNLFTYNKVNWPVDIGAPWTDVNNDGNYNFGVDSPYIYPDDMLYYVTNDNNENYSSYGMLCKSSGLEFRRLIYSFNRTNFLRDVVFQEITVINKGWKKLSYAQFSYFTNINIADHLANWMGCDPVLNLGFGYNCCKGTYLHPNEVIPAVGIMVLKGADDNKMMTSFSGWEEDAWILRAPECCSANQTGDIYNLQSGKFVSGKPYINPIINEPTSFLFDGDPESGTGWLEGNYGEGERSISVNSGPIDFNPGDTVKLVYAIFAAQGKDHLNSVTELKNKSKLIKQFYLDSLSTNKTINYGYSQPMNYKLSQNYPNPFNASTKIEYEIPADDILSTKEYHVTLKVYDILGRLISELVNKFQSVGKYEATFNGTGLASGIYICRLSVGEISLTRKMVLLR